MQDDTIEVIGHLSEEEFERKNKVALLNENFIREQAHSLTSVRKVLMQGCGVWRDEKKYLSMGGYKTGDGVKAVMQEKQSNGFLYYEGMTELEKKVFKEVDSQGWCELFSKEKKEVKKVEWSA